MLWVLPASLKSLDADSPVLFVLCGPQFVLLKIFKLFTDMEAAHPLHNYMAFSLTISPLTTLTVIHLLATHTRLLLSFQGKGPDYLRNVHTQWDTGLLLLLLLLRARLH
jgi:hypothetical protein